MHDKISSVEYAQIVCSGCVTKLKQNNISCSKLSLLFVEAIRLIRQEQNIIIYIHCIQYLHKREKESGVFLVFYMQWAHHTITTSGTLFTLLTVFDKTTSPFQACVVAHVASSK